MLTLPKLDRSKPRSQQIFEIIKRAITNNELRPGEKIGKEQLCKMFNVSRTPASDALHKLAEQGLVEIFPQHGTFVSKIDLESFRESNFLRQCIEVGIVKRIAGKLDAEQIAQLETNLRIQNAIADELDFNGFFKLDKEFHGLLSAFSGLRKLDQTLLPLRTHLERVRKLIVPLPERMKEAHAEHEAILGALKGNSPAKAEKAMLVHLDNSVNAMEKIVKNQPELFD